MASKSWWYGGLQITNSRFGSLHFGNSMGQSTFSQSRTRRLFPVDTVSDKFSQPESTSRTWNGTIVIGISDSNFLWEQSWNPAASERKCFNWVAKSMTHESLPQGSHGLLNRMMVTPVLISKQRMCGNIEHISLDPPRPPFPGIHFPSTLTIPHYPIEFRRLDEMDR